MLECEPLNGHQSGRHFNSDAATFLDVLFGRGIHHEEVVQDCILLSQSAQVRLGWRVVDEVSGC